LFLPKRRTKNETKREVTSKQQQKGAAAEQHGKDEVVSSVWLAPSFLSHAAAAGFRPSRRRPEITLLWLWLSRGNTAFLGMSPFLMN
jgi:hypothetical protein